MKNKRYYIKRSVAPDVHVMNNNEGSLLRKLMSQTGLNEAEIRAIKKYRVMLSEAQKKGQIQNNYFDYYKKRHIKNVKRYLKDAKKQLSITYNCEEVIKYAYELYLRWYRFSWHCLTEIEFRYYTTTKIK